MPFGTSQSQAILVDLQGKPRLCESTLANHRNNRPLPADDTRESPRNYPCLQVKDAATRGSRSWVNRVRATRAILYSPSVTRPAPSQGPLYLRTWSRVQIRHGLVEARLCQLIPWGADLKAIEAVDSCGMEAGSRCARSSSISRPLPIAAIPTITRDRLRRSTTIPSIP
jgi:hypothetical protein